MFPSAFIPAGWPSEYTNWRDAIGTYIRQISGPLVPIYLNAGNDVLSEIASIAGIETSTPDESLIDAIRPVLKLNDPQSLFETFRALQYWKRDLPNTKEDPPFFPLLLVTVLAAERMQNDGEMIATNYYGRLTELFGLDASLKDKVGISYRRHVAPFWNDLNDWLAAHSEVGSPTAFPISSLGWTDYVGVPIGQALIRAAEQQKIERLFFNAYFNEGGIREDVEEEEFLENFDNWMLGSDPTPRLKLLVTNAGDIIKGAVWELFQRWQPSESVDGVRIRRPKLELRLSLSRVLGGQSARLSIVLNHDEDSIHRLTASAKIGAHENVGVRLRGDDQLGMGIIADVESSVADVLSHAMEIRIREPDEALTRYGRSARAVIPFSEVVGGVLTEAKAIEFGVKYTLLIARPLVDVVVADLVRLGSSPVEVSIGGIPDDWAIYRDYELKRVGSAHEAIPLQKPSNPQIRLIGGTTLPGVGGTREFDLSDPPQISVRPLVTKSGFLAVIYKPDGTTEKVDVDLFAEFLSVTFKLPGRYNLNLFESPRARRAISHRDIVLRSADVPRSLPTPNPDALTLQFDEESRLYTVDHENGDEFDSPAAVLQGARLISGNLPIFHASSHEKQTSEGIALAGEEETLARLETGKAKAELPTCLLDNGKSHHKKFETIPPFRNKRFQEWLCLNCGAFDFTDTRSRKRKKNSMPVIGSPKKIESDSIIGGQPTNSPERAPLQMSLLVDGSSNRAFSSLCAIGKGHEREAVLVASADPDSYPKNALWRFAAAGHLDISGMVTDSAQGSWRVTPPTFHEVPEGYRLVGSRSVELVNAIQESLKAHGGVLTEVESESSEWVSELLIAGIDEAGMHRVVEYVNQIAGEGLSKLITLENQVSTNFLDALPSLSVLLSTLPTESYLDNQRLVFSFDLNNLRWEQSREVNLVGSAVRDSYFGHVYRYIAEGDPLGYQVVRCGYRLAKYLAASFANVRLLSYNNLRQEISAPLGADLPLLYTRAVITKSGVLPEICRANGRVVYKGVDEGIFTQLQNLLLS